MVVVLFDLEGTLVQSMETDQKAVLEFRTKTREELVTLGIPRSALEGVTTSTLMRNKALEYVEEHFSEEEAKIFHREMDKFLKKYELYWADRSRIFSDTLPTLRRLRELGYKMGVITNTSRSILLSAVLFDLVGTLIEESSSVLNTADGYYENQVKAIHGSLEEDGISVDWSSFKNRYEQVRIRQKERSRQTLREYDMCERVSDTLSFFNCDVSSASNIIRRAVDAYMIPYIISLRIAQSAYDLLKTLYAEYKLGLVTNFAYPSGAYRILDRFVLRPFFKAIAISGEVGWKKPSQRIFEFAPSRISAKPEEAIFVGDDYEADIAGAKKTGMKTIFLRKESINSGKADATIESLIELPSAIKRITQWQLPLI